VEETAYDSHHRLFAEEHFRETLEWAARPNITQRATVSGRALGTVNVRLPRTAQTLACDILHSKMHPKATKEIRERREPRQQKENRRQKSGGWRRGFWIAFSYTWKIFVGLLALGTALSFRPNFSVQAQPLNDPSNPLSVPFVITNEGKLPLYVLQYVIHVKSLVDANQKTFPHPGSQHVPDLFIMADSYPKWKILYAGDQATIIPQLIRSPDFQFAVPLQRGELAVEIIYKYGLWPFNEKRQYSFTAMASAKGQTWVKESRTD